MAPAPAIRVATYNIHFANAQLDAVIDAVRQSQADVVCLQETNSTSETVMRRELGVRYPQMRFLGSVHPYLAGGFGVLSSLPIVNEEFVPPKHGLFGACVFEVKHQEERVQIINVHLQPVILPEKQGASGIVAVLQAFDQAEQIHAAEIRDILTHASSKRACLIVGDFNSIAASQAPALLAQQGFVDSFAAVNEDPDSHPTWHWPTRIGEAQLRIDYIFHTPSLRTVESRVIKTQGSDHYLLVSEIEISLDDQGRP